MSKNFAISSFIAFSLLFVSPQVYSQNYDYLELTSADLEVRTQEVNRRVKEAQALIVRGDDQRANRLLKNTLVYIFARPDRDHQVSRLVPLVRLEMRGLDAFESSLYEIAQASINTINSGSSSPRQQATAYFILENLMSELKPNALRNPDINKVFSLIRDSEINFNSQMRNEMKVNAMVSSPRDFSSVAEEIIGPSESKPRKRNWFQRLFGR